MTTRSFIIDIATGDIVSESMGSFDNSAKAGTRTTSEVPTLSTFCERFVVDNKDSFDKKVLINLIRLGVAQSASSDLGIDKSLLAVPRLGRRFRVSNASGNAPPVDIFLKTITYDALKAACIAALEIKEEDFDWISAVDVKGNRWVEILTNDHVEVLVADSEVMLYPKETAEETAARLKEEAEWLNS